MGQPGAAVCAALGEGHADVRSIVPGGTADGAADSPPSSVFAILFCGCGGESVRWTGQWNNSPPVVHERPH